MLRVVLDTNIYVAAFAGHTGPNNRIWKAAVAGRYLLLISPAILTEIASVLRQRFGWPEQVIQNRIKRIAKLAQIVPRVTTLSFILADPSDDRILECVVAGISGSHKNESPVVAWACVARR